MASRKPTPSVEDHDWLCWTSPDEVARTLLEFPAPGIPGACVIQQARAIELAATLASPALAPQLLHVASDPDRGHLDRCELALLKRTLDERQDDRILAGSPCEHLRPRSLVRVPPGPRGPVLEVSTPDMGVVSGSRIQWSLPSVLYASELAASQRPRCNCALAVRVIELARLFRVGCWYWRCRTAQHG